MNRTWTFVVGYAVSKDALMAGQVDGGAVAVTVSAADRVDARLVAEQMVGALGVEPTSVTEIDRRD